jgi:hypothetical protein
MEAGPGGDGLGGGIFVGVATVCLRRVEITGNRALGGPGSVGGQNGQGVGGGIYNLGGTVGVRHTRIHGNLASTSDNDVFGEIMEGC